MARIRTVKPEFWTDERLTECSVSARLFFIGLLNFSDDNGNLVYSAKRLKMQIFPADNIETEPLIQELITHGLLVEYSKNDCKYLHIKGFTKHQKINRPSKTEIPLMEDSLSTHGVLTDGREGKGKDKEEESNTARYRFAGEVIRISEKDFLQFKKTYHCIPDLDAELLSADKQYQKEPPGNWFIALSNRLNARHQQLLSRKPPDKPKRQLSNKTVIGAT